MSYAEFPHVNYEDTDFGELIHMYKKVVADYDGTLKTITELSQRLTTYENNVDSKIIQTVNNVVPGAVANAVNVFKNDVDKSLMQLNERVNHLSSDLANLSNNMDRSVNQLQSNISTVEQELQQISTSFTNMIQSVKTELTIKIEKTFIDAILHSDNSVSNLNKEMLQIVEEVYKKIDEVSKENGRDMVIALWKYCLCQYGYTAYQWYMDSTVTCQQWHCNPPTCIEWYCNGLNYFNWFDRRTQMFSPVTGELGSVQKAVMELAMKLKVNAITAGEYDAMEITADQFENMQMTSGEYDWAGNILEEYYSE